MIHQQANDITRSALSEAAHTPDARLREILCAGIRHLHAFVRETGLTEPEFQQLCAHITRAGQLTNASHNEVVLAAGSLGVSALVCLLNNGGADGPTASTANLLGPFWRDDSPAVAAGGSIVRGNTPGTPLFVQGWVHDTSGQPVAGARVDVWHASADGFYENQDPTQANMNLRGQLRTGADGGFAFRSIKPGAYPIPLNGPVGDLLRAQGRHNMRPAHIHFLIKHAGYKTQFAQVYSNDDPNLDTDVQFAVTQPLVGEYVHHAAHEAAPAADVNGPWFSLEHHFVIQPGTSTLPRPPITGKATGSERPAQEVLLRRR